MKILEIFVPLAIVLFIACEPANLDQSWLFEKINKEQTGINFINKVENTEDFNIFLYRNFYNGGGVAIGDINNDGLSDVYFTSNMDNNKLYLNKGNFTFKDISTSAGISSGNKWSTGVVLVDINADGLLDIYVCNAGYRKGSNQKNELYINNGDLTFTDKASEYGLDENGYTTHAAFFDYDKDGDLDAYILNNSFIPVNTLNYNNKRKIAASEWPVPDFLKGGGDKLLRNDNGKFQDVTTSAGIYNSLIGFGLGVTVGDINGDQWEDIYISNDFFERDYLYINQKNGTFKEQLESYMDHISAFSMGADMADVNNDSRPEIFVTDMLPDNEYRLKTTTSFEPYSVYKLKLDRGFYHQYMQNTLQLNNGNNNFSEIAHYSGVSSSDWSWGALLFDIDNDGYRDIYICNGIYHDLTDKDFIDFFANEIVQKTALSGSKKDVNDIISKMPSTPIKNKIFINNGDLTFKDMSDHQNNEPSFSNGAAYGDLDNDGDLDLVVNNVNQDAFIFKNRARQISNNHFLKVRLEGKGLNTYAIGSKVYIFMGKTLLNAELIPSRGFQSSVDYNLIFGLGQNHNIDSLLVIWPDQSGTLIKSPPVDTLLIINQTLSTKQKYFLKKPEGPVLVESIRTNFEPHREDNFVDFYEEGLLIRMLSREGPKAAVSDVNGDGLMDIFIGGAYKQAGRLYIQYAKGFKLSKQPAFNGGALFEDTAAQFFDADGDDDTDLFIGSGGNRDFPGSVAMQDRLYLNDGHGNFTLHTQAFPNNGYNTAVVLPFDMDSDGDLDLFVGSRSIPGNYGISPKHYLYENDGKANFDDVTDEKFASLHKIGMITDATLSDVNGDEIDELIIVGEWMSPTVCKITEGAISIVKSGMQDYSGWWNAIVADDIDDDGDVDLILGNRGENFYFTGTIDRPAKLWLYDFDNNGSVENIITRNIKGRDVTVLSKKELTQQVVSLKKRNIKYAEFADKSIQDLFSSELLAKATVKEGKWFKTSIAINDGEGSFKILPLPRQVQFSSVNSIYTTDLNGDGRKDIIMGGNNSGFLPQFSKLDASFGVALINHGKCKFNVVSYDNSGLFIEGDVRQFLEIEINGKEHMLCLINNREPELFKILNEN